jgi:RNA polymerase sigma factor (sigma-70 family)
VRTRTLQAVLRTLADAMPPTGDGELLRRFTTGDEDAFAELVRRHGRLVWAVCRHLTGSDAEADDAFQATFLVLLKNAGKIREPGRLSAWLHGVAYKVAAKARLASKRRSTRERAAAVSERNGHAVADSAWDRALAAVHEELGRLPETLRVPFVLCCLEGKGTTEAAEQLGWKLGTLSGRLTRAKDALIARLNARGLTVGAVAGLGLLTPPAAAIAKATALGAAGSTIPTTVLQLTQGVIGMSTTTIKVLAVAVMVTCGLGLGVGSGWMANAEAQTTTKKAQTKTDPADEVKRLELLIEKSRLLNEQNRLQDEAARRAVQAENDALNNSRLLYEQAIEALSKAQVTRVESATAKTSKWDYDFVVVSDMSQTKFVEFLQDRENRGWDYNGTTTYLHNGKPTQIWVFRRPSKAVMQDSDGAGVYRKAEPGTSPPLRNYPLRTFLPGQTDKPSFLLPATLDPAKPPAKPTTVKEVQDEIVRLQGYLKLLQDRTDSTTNTARTRVVFPAKDLLLDPTDTMSLLSKLAEKKFAKDRYSLSASSAGVTVEGDKEVIDWFTAMVKRLSDK